MTFDDLTTEQLREEMKRAALAKDYDRASALLAAFVARGPSDAAQVTRLLKALANRDANELRQSATIMEPRLAAAYRSRADTIDRAFAVGEHQ